MRAIFQVEIEQSHLLDVLTACTDETAIALQALRLNEELDLYVSAKMYAKALEVSSASSMYTSRWIGCWL